MGSIVDPFGRTDTLSEAHGEHTLFSEMLHEYLDAMYIDSAGMVLDMSCGAGLAARAIAHRAGFPGHVIGVDLSPHLVAAAERLAGEEGIGDCTEFQTGDVDNLDISDGTFDAVVAHTLLSHVENPSAVVAEATRVLRSGGVLGIFDGDYASLTFAQEDPVKSKASDEVLINAVVTNPRVMRQMPRLLRKAGLELVTSFP